MKWVNLAERKPTAMTENTALRLLSHDMYFGTDDIIGFVEAFSAQRGEEVMIDKEDGDYHQWPTKVMEWLDESELHSDNDAEEGMMIVQVPVGSFIVPPDMVDRLDQGLINDVGLRAFATELKEGELLLFYGNDVPIEKWARPKYYHQDKVNELLDNIREDTIDEVIKNMRDYLSQFANVSWATGALTDLYEERFNKLK